MKIEEINGRKIKKYLEADRAMLRYHNRHVDGSGNFGYTIQKNGHWYSLDGQYDEIGEVYTLDFSSFNGMYREHLDKHLYGYVDTGFTATMEKVKDLLNFWEESRGDE